MMSTKTAQRSATTCSILLGLVLLALHLHPASALAAGTQVTVTDHGLNMTMATYTLPKGWTLENDVATDPNTGQFTRYKMDKKGPRGEIIRSLPPIFYSTYLGQGFPQAWQQAAWQASEDILQNVRFGELRSEGSLLSKLKKDPQVMKNLEAAGVNGLYEVEIDGRRNGKSYEGKLLILNMQADAQSGVFILALATSPAGLLEDTIDTDLKIGRSEKANPRYTQLKQQISQRAMQESQARHNQRMRANQQQFDSHQKMMQGIYQSNDRQNQQWMNNFRSGGSTGSGAQDYSGHDAYIDSIHEQSTFYDPDSGQNVSRDGQYDYNYTDGMGGYYGTDDPSFNPNALPGDWQETEPLTPRY